MSACPDEAVLAAAPATGLTEALEAHLDGCAACRKVLAAAAAEEPAQGALGRYELGALLGAGGMGVVYAARDPKLGRTVALKVMRAADATSRARFLREAQVMAKLSHPAVVSVFDLGEVGDRVFIAMEHVDGGTLRAWLTRPRTVPETLRLLGLVGQGLSAAHRAGVVHRDFKPENVLLGADGRARVTDFGLANWSSTALPAGVEATTRTVGLVGTPAYMAPEQLRGERADARSDQFSYCVVLYEALTGRRPRDGRTVGELREQPVDARPRRDGVAPHVWAAIARGLSADPALRFPSMDALLEALERAPTRRRPGTWMALAASLAVGLIGWQALEGAAPAPPATAEDAGYAVPRPKVKPPPPTETDVLVEPGEAEPLPRDGTEVFLEPGATRDFKVSGLVRARLDDPFVLDAEGTEVELSLRGLRPGRAMLTLEFLGGSQRHWPVTVRTPLALPAEDRRVALGQPLDVPLDGITRVSVGDAKILEVERTKIGVRFVGRAAGTTNALLWTRDATRLELRFTVAGPDTDGVVELEVGLQRVLATERVDRARVEPPDLCEVLLLNGYELLLTPRRRGEGTLELVRGEQVDRRALRISERR